MANGYTIENETPEEVAKRSSAYNFFFGPDRMPFSTPTITGEAGATQIGQRAGFYDALAQAQGAGRAIAGQQQTLADMLAARARGEGTSIAELQLQQALEANRRAAAGSLATTRGMNPAAAQRLLLQQQATLGQSAAGQAAILRAQEQLAAQQALGQQLTGMRGAETQMFSQAGQLGLGQEKLAAELTEAEKNRQAEIQIANQRAEIERQRNQAASDEAQRESAASGWKTAGKIAGGIGAVVAAPFTGGASLAALPLIAALADGGKVEAKKKMPKAKIVAAHAAAKKAMPAFKEQYGEEKGKAVAYATMMKAAKANKLAEGDLAKLDNKKNDVVPALLSEGEIVVPRSIVMSPKPAEAAGKFVDALLANKKPKEAKMEALKAALRKKK
jgi:hypothetical protein